MALGSSRVFVYTLFQDLLILAAIFAASETRFLLEDFDPFLDPQKRWAVILAFLVYKGSFQYWNLYQIQLHLSLREFVNRLLIVNITVLVILTAVYYTYPPLIIGRGILSLTVVYVMLFTVLYRLVWSTISGDVAFNKNLLIVGDDAAAMVVIAEVDAYRHSGYRVVGLITKDPMRLGEEVTGGHHIIGTRDELIEICENRDVDQIVVAMEESRGNLPVKQLMELKMRGVTITEGTQFHEQFTGKIVLEGLRASWFIFSEGFKVGRFQQVTKRAFDLLASTILLIATAPLCVIVALIIKLTDRGPILYRQERVGLKGQTFTVYKFRSMYTDSEKEGPQWAQEKDPRVTPIGRFIRRFRVDEIPQILNVVRGEMSFVGPRPERPYFVHRLAEVIPYYSQRHVVKPGITGWAQVRYPYGATVEDAKEKLQLDLYYIKNVSLAFDIKILMETVAVVLGKMKVH
ncbi:MAG: TIGR03013 family PEP-CTERM/XrtA system glycosyltransferase [Deltaproteobacteria bacterium]|nr:TIGR03013 family PEP-CTERM/XrtA system glycosyltransferase [bacterium]MCB9475880.1 TIGR03013 family PEP-CTERM/XrtA system glycosyltransferase [Deltaproteobacteria bacterium]MCB9488542.1 TIGR03013 family PEP-CTERM/XrtA system glycosyltransferase [Deltaproteobacteria bacterium]